MSFIEQYGPWAIVVGGSEGIGAGYARELAAKGLNLILTARSSAELGPILEELKQDHPNCEVRTSTGDLGQAQAAAAIIETASGLDVGLLICNAGAAQRWKYFLDDDLDYSSHLLHLNVDTMLALVHHFGNAMKARARGGILLMSSLAMAAGNPGFAVYGGAKAFVSIFGEALWYELRPFNVHVLAYAINSTDTPTMQRSYPKTTGKGADPYEVAAHGLKLLDKGPIGYFGNGEAATRMMQSLPRAEALDLVMQQVDNYH